MYVPNRLMFRFSIKNITTQSLRGALKGWNQYKSRWCPSLITVPQKHRRLTERNIRNFTTRNTLFGWLCCAFIHLC